MPIKFSCKQCDAKLKVSSQAAGRTFNCPQCNARLRVPAPRALATASSTDRAGVPASQPKALHTPATADGLATVQRKPVSTPAATPTKPIKSAPIGLPFDDDEWDAALNPYESPKEEATGQLPSYGDDNRKSNRRELRWARWGIKTVNGGLSAVGFSIILSFVLAFLTSEEPGGVIASLGLAVIGLYGIGSVALFVGPFLCLGTPEKTGAHGYAKLTCIGQTVQLILGGVLVAEGVNDATEMIGLLMLAFISGVVSYFALVQYMVAMGKYLQRDEVVDSASTVMMLGVVNAISLVLMIVLPLIGLEFPEYLWLFGMAAFGAWLTAVFGGLIAVFKYVAALDKLGKAL